MKISALYIIFLWTNCISVFGAGLFDTPSLESILHAPPGMFSKTSSGDLFGGLTGITGLTGQLQSITSNPDALKKLYDNFKKIFKKDTPETEDNKRMGIFQNKLFGVLNHNIRAISGQESYEQGVNQFSDMSPQEVIAQYTGYKPDNISSGVGNKREESPLPDPMMQGHRQKRDVPESRDWRKYGVVSPVKNQKDCGSCTLFAATGALESSWKLWHQGDILDLSEQELLDCIPNGNGHYACQGNSYESTLNYQKNHGQGADSSYVYTSRQGTCRSQGVIAKVKEFYRIDQNEGALKEKLGGFGPVGIAVHVNDAIMQYRSGVWEGNCGGDINHAMLAVGYGNENGKDYWLIKNSWDSTWGDKGYLKLRRNANNLCQIASYAFFMTA